MPSNEELAAVFESIGRILELLGEDKFRAAAHARAARVLADLPRSAADLARDRAALLAIEGIGPKMADKIIELCTTGRIAEHQALLERVPAGLLPLLEIPGLGPKTVRLLWTEGGVTDVASLKQAIESGAMAKLPRMGAKSVEKIRASLAFTESAGGRIPLGIAVPLAESLVASLSAHPAARRVAYAGSLRRGRDTIGDIDILAATDDADALADAFVALPGVAEVLTRGSRTSVRMSTDGGAGRWGDGPGVQVQVDLRTVPPASWGAAMMYFTGSKEHNVAMRELARRNGRTLTEYGLFPLDGKEGPPHSRGVVPVAGADEESVFAALGVPWVPPEIRESHGEMDLDSTPNLLEVAHIRAELHAHTTASDGALSIRELAAAALARGFHTIAVTDHSRSSAVAGGLSPERLREHIRAVREVDASIDGIRILAGSEVDILADGSLDYDDDLLAELDVVVASPHAALSQEPAAATARLLRAIRHPAVRVLGHPTGRLINRRAGLSPAMDEIVAAAREHDVALEINAHWMRLDLRDTHVRAAMEGGCVLAVNCDVHHVKDFDNLRFGVVTARRGWVTPERCVNAWSAEKLHRWLRR